MQDRSIGVALLIVLLVAFVYWGPSRVPEPVPPAVPVNPSPAPTPAPCPEPCPPNRP